MSLENLTTRPGARVVVDFSILDAPSAVFLAASPGGPDAGGVHLTVAEAEELIREIQSILGHDIP